MQLKVKVDVELGEGAKVTLSEKHTNEVVAFIKTLLTEEKEPKSKRTYIKRNKYVPWTQLEDAKVAQLSSFKRGLPRSRAITSLGKELKRSRQTIIARLHHLKKKESQKVVVGVNFEDIRKLSVRPV